MHQSRSLTVTTQWRRTESRAFSVSENGALKGYLVFIDANNTKYAVEFDASGQFLRSKTIY